MEDTYDMEEIERDPLIERATESLKRSTEHWNPIYAKSKEDLLFLSDEPGAQWGEKDFADRKSSRRPTLTIDQLGQFINQVSNGIRMNTPTINISPSGGDATVLSAEIYQGLVREIEQASRADIAYDTAADFAIKGSIGFFRVDHDFKCPSSFDQDLKITRVINPHVHFPDPDSIEPDGSDSKMHHIVESVRKSDFESRWPGKEPVSFEVEGLPELDEDELYVVEYFELTEEDGTLYRLNDGTEAIVEGTFENLVAESKVDIIMHRPTTVRKIKRYWLSGKEELDSTDVPGEFIPVIPVYGKEAWRDGKRHLESLIRNSKDAQRMFNYWKSTEAELLMKQPKAPVIAARGSIDDHAEGYINPDGVQVLEYEPYDDQNRPLPAPSFGNVPRMSEGIIMASRGAVDDVKSTMGMYGASLGKKSNETSGVAIDARKEEGDRATYHFGGNLLRSIEHCGRVLVSAIPQVYVGPRVISVIGREEESEMIGINGALAEGQEESYDLSRGQYAAVVTTGAPFATMRQEAADFFKQIVMTTPELMQTMGDLVFKYMDFPGAQAVSDRLKRLLPPEVLGEEGMGPEIAQAQQQMQQLGQALQESQQQTAQLEEQLKNKTAEVQIKAQTEMAKNETEKSKQQVEVMGLTLEREKIKADLAIKQEELDVKREEISLKRQELGMRLADQALATKEQPTR